MTTLPWFAPDLRVLFGARSMRAARPDDVASLQEIERAADARFAEVGHPELADGEVVDADAARRMIEQGRVLVVVEASAPIAWAYVGRCGVEAALGQICVHPSVGRRGIGTALLEYVLATARARSEPSLVLSTQLDVAWNRPWYERHGFVVLAPAEWTPAMHDITAAQAAAGLESATRCHMRARLR